MHSEKTKRVSLSLSLTVFYSVITFAIVFSSIFLTKSLVVRYSLINYSNTISKEFSHVFENPMSMKRRNGKRSRILSEYTIISGDKIISDPYNIKDYIKMPDKFPEIESIGGDPYVFVNFKNVDGSSFVLIAPAYQLKVLENTLNFFTLLLSFASAFVVVVVGLFFSNKVLSPLKKISTQLEKVKISKLDAKMPDQRYREYQQLADTINSMLLRLKDGFERQEQFVSDASHELRTPLSSIFANLEMLSRWGKDDPRVLDDSLEDMKMSVKRLSSMVEALLRLSKGNLEVNFEKVDLREIAKEIKMESETLYPDFDFEIKGNGKAKTDANGLKEILRIFISNAVRYSFSMKKVIMWVEKDRISVEDFGIGMNKEALEHIFDRFYRADNSRSQEGFGIGLSIAKKIADAIGARIEVESEDGKGSKFSLVFLNGSKKGKSEK